MGRIKTYNRVWAKFTTAEKLFLVTVTVISGKYNSILCRPEGKNTAHGFSLILGGLSKMPLPPGNFLAYPVIIFLHLLCLLLPSLSVYAICSHGVFIWLLWHSFLHYVTWDGDRSSKSGKMVSRQEQMEGLEGEGGEMLLKNFSIASISWIFLLCWNCLVGKKIKMWVFKAALVACYYFLQ